MIRIHLCQQIAGCIGTHYYEAVGSRVTTVRAAVANLVARFPDLRSEIFEDSGALRARVGIFVHSVAVRDRMELSDVIGPDSTVHILRSLGPPESMCWSSDWRERRRGVTLQPNPEGAALT